MTRLEANRKIADMIKYYVEAEPNWRFHQILQNMYINTDDGEDRWYEESEDTYRRMIKI